MMVLYVLIYYSIPCIGFFGLWNVINTLYVTFPFSNSKLVDGYFSYKPDIVTKNTGYECAWIYTKNCLKYLFGIERPSMPWYMKINVVFCALGILFSIWISFLILLDEGLHLINLHELIDTVQAKDLF